MKYLILLSICILVLVSCGTIGTTDNQHITNQPDLNLSSETSGFTFIEPFGRKSTIDTIKGKPGEPDTIRHTGPDISDLLLYIYPNPTSDSVMIEFGNGLDIGIVNEVFLDLYYMNKKINTLEFTNIENNKVTISSDYLKENGTYTISFTNFPFPVSNSFVVHKK